MNMLDLPLVTKEPDVSQKSQKKSQKKVRKPKLMKLRNALIVVKDIKRSRQFYHDLFGLELILDNDGNMILTEGLVLQDEKIWRQFLIFRLP